MHKYFKKVVEETREKKNTVWENNVSVIGFRFNNSTPQAINKDTLEKLSLHREKKNPFDENAMALHLNGEKIGYITKEHSLRVKAGLEKYGQPKKYGIMGTFPKTVALNIGFGREVPVSEILPESIADSFLRREEKRRVKHLEGDSP